MRRIHMTFHQHVRISGVGMSTTKLSYGLSADKYPCAIFVVAVKQAHDK